MARTGDPGTVAGMNRIRLLLVLAATALLVLPALAAARPHQRSFDRTYPHASRLCAKVESGKAPKRLADSSAKVAEACAQLRSAFTTAQEGLTAAVTPLREQADAARRQAREACEKAGTDNDSAACRQARQDAHATLKDLRAKAREAIKAYRTSVRTARKAFWSTVKGLRGGASQQADASEGPSPSSGIPASS